MSVVSLYDKLPVDFKTKFGPLMELMPKLGHFRKNELQQWLIRLQMILSIVAGQVLPCGDTICFNFGKPCRVCVDDVIADIVHMFARHIKRPCIADSPASKSTRQQTRRILASIFTTVVALINFVPDNMACEGVVYVLGAELIADVSVAAMPEYTQLHNVLTKHYDKYPIAYFIWHIDEFINKCRNRISPRLNYIIKQSLKSLTKLV